MYSETLSGKRKEEMKEGREGRKKGGIIIICEHLCFNNLWKEMENTTQKMLLLHVYQGLGLKKGTGPWLELSHELSALSSV